MLACLRGLLDGLDPACLSPRQAVRLVEERAEVERLAAAGKTLAAGRAMATGAWSDGTCPDFETWLARVSATEAALRSGALSLPRSRRSQRRR